MDSNMSRSSGIGGSNQAPPLGGNPSLLQPYDTNNNYLVSSEPPFPIIPILRSNNSYMSDSSGYYVQEMVPPVQNNNAIVANNLSYQLDQLNLMSENSLANQGHRRFFSDQLSSSSNDAYFGTINFDSSISGSGGANASGSHISNISDVFDEETFYKFFDLYEPDNSSSTISTFQAEEQQPNENGYVSGALLSPLPPFSPIPSLRFNASASEGILIAAGLSTQLRRSQSMDSINTLSFPKIGTMHAGASSSFSPTNRPFSEGRMKHYSDDDIAAISQVDPRRANRILANRRAFARIKDRNERHKVELENQLRLLQSKVPALRADYAMMKSHLENLTEENRQLQLQTKEAEQKTRLQEELTERLNVEIAHLKMLQVSHAPNFGMRF